MKAVRVALVGCGRIAESHIQAIAKSPELFELVGVCDSNPKACENLNRLLVQPSHFGQGQGVRVLGSGVYTEVNEHSQNEHNEEIGQKGRLHKKSMDVPHFTQLDTLLETVRPELVSLCTPSGLHAEQAGLAMQGGAHVLTEKPMATTLSDAMRMVEEAKKHNKHLLVVKQLRLWPRLQFLKQAIESGYFGQLYLLSCNVFWTRPESYFQEAPWRGTRSMDGGVLMNQASHHVDLLHWLGGEVKSTQTTAATLGRAIEAADTAILQMTFQSGALGVLQATILTYPNNLETSLTILGEKGTVQLGGKALDEVRAFEFAVDVDKTAFMQATQPAGHGAYYQHVYKVLRGVEKPLVDGEEALKTMRLLTS